MRIKLNHITLKKLSVIFIELTRQLIMKWPEIVIVQLVIVSGDPGVNWYFVAVLLHLWEPVLSGHQS